MKINDEEVELVTDFATLTDGVPIWVMPCICDGKHRGMILGGEFHPLAGRIVYWVPNAHPELGPTAGLIDKCVALGIVYRVVDGLDLEAEKRAEKKARPVKRELVDADADNYLRPPQHPNCRSVTDPLE